ncbi:Thiamine-phosphate synthase [Methylobacterium tardum]|uniref:Thiamine-phosphate synthase n=1 Tax=Methylobacterium tardum TaxID=374432 RepID=A0AA37TQV5_9HYPH|nr:thiamine phosphate synthase [Methylobacterium tardum]URD39312.1 thiamine phosphate synthase [Methylobacterium tardum]GJE48811.1 Thiamine-phosphate synthase [Methylobacterium tardum]GLS73952.1 putative thiamine-phosphate synthase [Methylobacterium tardum]
MRALPSPLLAVTDRHGHPRPLVETVQAILDGGGRWIWFRDRDLEPEARKRLGEAVAGRVRAMKGVLTVGGDVALARALGADGVHLGGGSGSEAIGAARSALGEAALIGVSAHTPREAVTAAQAGADYVTLSPIYATASKPGYGPALGLTGLADSLGAGLPVVALGGLGPGTVGSCRAVGAAGFAVMGGLMRAADPAAATRALLKAWSAAETSAARASP